MFGNQTKATLVSVEALSNTTGENSKSNHLENSVYRIQKYFHPEHEIT